MPVALVVVTAGHSSIRSGGQVITGGVVSRTMIVCTRLDLLLQVSVAVQVRAITLVLPQLVVTRSLKPIVTWLHPSVAVATPVTLVRVSAGHSRTRSAGQGRFGGVMSRTGVVLTAT